MRTIYLIVGGIPVVKILLLVSVMLLLAGCGATHPPQAPKTSEYRYLIGPGDNVNVFVWRQPELSATVPVRPDGKITTPLVEDLPASGKTPTRLARDMEKVLRTYIRDPVVTIIVTGFSGPYSQQVRVVGEAVNPQAIPYREDMTVLDVMIAVGGLTEFAAGNRSSIVRKVGGKSKQFGVRLGDLLKEGDVQANVPVMPGDTLIIPESWF